MSPSVLSTAIAALAVKTVPVRGSRMVGAALGVGVVRLAQRAKPSGRIEKKARATFPKEVDRPCHRMEHPMTGLQESSRNFYREKRMKLRFVGSTSNQGGCPTIYETDRGTLVIQGVQVTDSATLAEARDILDGEAFVEVPKELFRFLG
ncbi:hypothetical protein AB0M44_39025 [Streptosporangium subroseum]|uniref:hypothetical protein n=1 Tax=Streptosporangium subroseum TaxID=106412 RepID=UPI0034349EBF